MSVFKQAMAIPYYRWHEIEALIEKTDDAFMKKALSQLMQVKRNREKNEPKKR